MKFEFEIYIKRKQGELGELGDVFFQLFLRSRITREYFGVLVFNNIVRKNKFYRHIMNETRYFQKSSNIKKMIGR